MMIAVAAAMVEEALDKARLRRRRLPAPALRRAIREDAGLAQADIARAIGVTRVSVHRFEHGRHPRDPLVVDRYADLLRRLASAK